MKMSRLLRRIAITTLLACSPIAATGCGDSDEPTLPEPEPEPEPEQKTIVGLAQATPSLSTLVAVVQFASENDDLVNLLANPGTLTVFAPTNAAFDALAVELTGNPSAKATDLLTADNKALLRSVLQYHVLTAEVKAAAIQFGKPVTTAQGSIFKIENGAQPKIVDGRNREATISATDVDASNGVVHVIDKVILPANKNIVETAIAASTAPAPQFTLLVEAVVAAELVDLLSGTGPFTVFAPTDAAFAAALTELNLTKEQLFSNKPLLTAVLTYHVVGARVLKAEVPVGSPIVTAQGAAFTIDSSLKVNDGRGRSANITATDLFTTNGVIHVIDKVILPPVE